MEAIEFVRKDSHQQKKPLPIKGLLNPNIMPTC